MLSIIVPTYLMSQAMHDLWASNLAQLEDVAAHPTQIVVVDNGSSHPPARATVSWPANRGVAPAWNEGRRHAVGEVLVFLTCTTRVERGWDANLVAVATSGRYIAMPFTNGEKPYGIGISGWCWAIQRTLADEIGPFDETFVPVQYEDTDFFKRAHDMGVEMFNVVGANVTRAARRQTWGDEAWAARSDLIHWSNRLRFHWKHGGDPNDVPDIWKVPLRNAIVEPAPVPAPLVVTA